MFEGKNIHFSPVDNKPLCSYSSKLCRQRRLNGYAFCIRHILEDKSAPFKRCTYVTRNNNQICQNAIPTSQERGYCHSHMQVAGIIPKTERKVKNPPKSADANGASGKSSDSNSNSSNSSNGGVKKDPNAVFKFEEEPSEIQWIPKGGRINGIVNRGKKINGKGKDQVKETGVVNGTIHNGSSGKSGKSETNKNGKVNQSMLMNGKDTPAHVKSRQTYAKKPTTTSSSGKKPKVIIESTTVINNKQTSGSLETTTTNGSGNLVENARFGLEVNILDSNVATPPCAPEHDKYFDQLKTLKSVEKSVSHSKQDSSDIVSAIKQSHINNNASSKPTNSPRTIPIPKSTTLPNSRNSNSNKNCSNVGICTSSGSSISSSSSVCVDLFNSICAQKVTNSLPPEFSPDKITIKSQNSSFEPRQEFLARVRQAFKLQYLTIKNSANDSDKNEKIWKRALRHSLLTCVAKNSSYCAHVIVQNDPKKYSDLVMVGNGKKSPAPKSNKKSAAANTVGSNGNNNKSRRKNGLADNNPSGGSEKSESRIVLTNGNSMSIMDDDIFGPVSPPDVRGHGKSKASLGTDEKLSSQKKKKARKAAVLSPCVANGLDEISHISPLDHHAPSIRSISAKKSSSDSLESAMNAKKRKFSETLNSESDSLSQHILNSVTEFRVPKVEDPSAHDLSDIDIKMENEQIGYNNYNGHISNHHHHTHPLLHPHSGSATTAKSSILSNAQLQHLLSQPDLRTLASAGHNAKLQRNQGINTVLNSVGSSDLVSSDGVITDASFDSTFDHSSQQDCDFSDDDLEKSLEFQIDPETEHQASRLLEDNELTEDDLNELFPETSNKIGRSDLSDLGVDFSSAFDANDIDYSLFANIFPFSRSSQSESISISNQY